MQIRACQASEGGRMCAGGELSVRIVSVLELWKAVCLITSEINMCDYSALGRCLERACQLLP